MDRHIGISKSQMLTACVVLLLCAAGATGYAQLINSNCGGREEPACGYGDAAYSANNDYAYASSQNMFCDYGLVEDK